MKKKVVEGSVVWDMANKILINDSHMVKLQEVKELWEGSCSEISLFVVFPSQ